MRGAPPGPNWCSLYIRSLSLFRASLVLRCPVSSRVPLLAFAWLQFVFFSLFPLCSVPLQISPCKALFADLSEVCISLDKLLDNKQKSSFFPALSPLRLSNIYFLGYPLGAVSSAQKQKQRGYAFPLSVLILLNSEEILCSYFLEVIEHWIIVEEDIFSYPSAPVL